MSNEVSVVVVARHGERLDYVMRDSGANWTATADRPFDSPLTPHGHEQAVKLGKHVESELVKIGVPLVTSIFCSPFLRCRQTARGAQKGMTSATSPLRVELGLAESINEQWYRSWSLPGADGTWGFKINGEKGYDNASLHPLATQPIQDLLADYKTDESIDLTYQSKTSIEEPYCFFPLHLESQHAQRQRMKHVVEAVSAPGKTVLLVSHGGPVTHLYEELTGNPWHVHGVSTYCCYSIYKRCGDGAWEPVQVNESDYLQEDLHGDLYVEEGSS